MPVTLRLDGAGKEPLSPLFNIGLEFFGPSTLEIVDAGFDEGCGVTPGAFDRFKEAFVSGSISGMVCDSVAIADADADADADATIMLTVDELEGGDRVLPATR